MRLPRILRHPAAIVDACRPSRPGLLRRLPTVVLFGVVAACRPAPVPTPPPTPTSHEDDRARVAFETGLTAFAAADYEAAVTAFDWALELEPAWLDARWNRASALAALGRFDDALVDARLAHEAAGTAETRYLLAWTMVGGGRFRDAVTLLQTATRPSPAEHLLHGWASLALGELEEAAESAQRARGASEISADADCLLGAIAERRSDAGTALAHYDDALDRLPDHLTALRASGLLLLRLGERAPARERLERFLELAPDRDPDRALVRAALDR